MNLKTVSTALIAMGATVLVYALFVMEISLGGSVINLDLLNTRQNLVTLGALGVLTGVILLATSLIVKTSAQETQTDNIQGTRKPKQPAISQQRRPARKPIFQDQLNRLNAWRDRFIFRLSIGMACGVMSLGFYPFEVLYFFTVPLFVILAMRKLPSAVAARKAFLVSGVSSFVLSLPTVLYSQGEVLGIMLSFLPTFVSVVLYLKYRKESAKQAASFQP